MALPFNLVRRCRPADVREGTGLEPVRGRVACGQGNLPADPGPCVAKRVHFIHPSRPWSARNDERGLKTRGAVGAWCLLATEKVRSYPEPRGGRSRFSRKKVTHALRQDQSGTHENEARALPQWTRSVGGAGHVLGQATAGRAFVFASRAGSREDELRSGRGPSSSQRIAHLLGGRSSGPRSP